MASKEQLVKCVQLAGRGRGLVAVKPIRAGQIILRDSPSLLYVSGDCALSFCSSCMRPCSPSLSPCHGCGAAIFCSSVCSSSHSVLLCTALSRIQAAGLDTESENQARFLMAAYHLALVSPSEFENLMLLDGAGNADAAENLQGFLEGAVRSWPWSPGEVSPSLAVASDLLVKESRNAFGLMAPTEKMGVRSTRGFGVYPTASFLNHNCLPNACRFDYVDAPGEFNTDIYIRALHDIPENVEVTISYFPINWSYKERQGRLAEEYGFHCECERCTVEQDWSEDDSTDSEDTVVSRSEEHHKPTGIESAIPDSVNVTQRRKTEKEEEEKEDGEEAMDEEDDFQHAMFFVKYLCPIDDCGGTMAPLSSDSEDLRETEDEEDILSTMECNMCGHVRTGEEFRQDLQQHGMIH